MLGTSRRTAALHCSIPFYSHIRALDTEGGEEAEETAAAEAVHLWCCTAGRRDTAGRRTGGDQVTLGFDW